MSEAELHVLRARLRGGSLHKAGKGELRLPLPAGYEYDETGRMRITPDEAVADAIATVFSYFEALQCPAGHAAPVRGAPSATADGEPRSAGAVGDRRPIEAVHDISPIRVRGRICVRAQAGGAACGGRCGA